MWKRKPEQSKYQFQKTETGAMAMEIYYDDLKEEKQEELLEGRGLESPEEGNLDVFPIATIKGVE